jgi:MSHA biogenesis protein MshJ
MIKFDFAKIEQAFNKITLRERILIFSALLICTFSISYYWIFEPLMVKQVKADKALKSVYNQEKKLNNEIAQVKLRLRKDPLQAINNKIAFSMQTLTALDKQLDDKLVKFIHAKKMPVALTKVLSRSPGVKVKSLTTQPVSVFNSAVDTAENRASDNSVADKAVFYKHTLELQLVGSYNAIYQYFLNLEAVPEKFYWSVLTYRVDAYPLAEVMIQIYTLSDQQDLVSG